MAGGIYGIGGGNPDPRVAEVDPNTSLWSTIKSDASAAGSFLYTNLIWDKDAPLWMNLGGAAISVVSIAAAIPSGGLSVAGGAAISASMGLGAKVILSEVATGTAAAIIVPPVAEIAADGITAATDAILGEETPAPSPELQAQLDGLSNFYQDAITPEDGTIAEAETLETVVAENSETEASADPVRAAFMDQFNFVASMIGNFIPQQMVGLVAGIAAAFMIATSGDENDETNKFQEISGLTDAFMEVALGSDAQTTPEYTNNNITPPAASLGMRPA